VEIFSKKNRIHGKINRGREALQSINEQNQHVVESYLEMTRKTAFDNKSESGWIFIILKFFHRKICSNFASSFDNKTKEGFIKMACFLQLQNCSP